MVTTCFLMMLDKQFETDSSGSPTFSMSHAIGTASKCGLNDLIQYVLLYMARHLKSPLHEPSFFTQQHLFQEGKEGAGELKVCFHQNLRTHTMSIALICHKFL